MTLCAREILFESVMCTGKIILAGGSGFLGRTLGKWLTTRDCEIVVLSRQPRVFEFGRTVCWDAHSLGSWAEELEDAAALINLAGRSVNCRYHARNRRQMMDSRILSTRVLGQAVRQCASAPPVWLNSSTATIYKHTFDAPHDEAGMLGATPEARDAFSIEVAQAWEAEFEQAETPSTRKVTLRTAMVFGDEPGGVFEVLRRLTRFGLGGKMGHGRQYISWIHAADFCRAIEWLIDNSNAEGIYNICAPNPISNAEMMATFRQTFGVPIGLPAARWMLEIGAFFLRTETELIIKSRRVIPARIMAEGFTFLYPQMETALADLGPAEHAA